MKLAAIAARNKVARRIDRLLFMEVSFCASFFFGFEASETA